MVKLKLYSPNQVMRAFWGMEDGIMPGFENASNNLNVYEKDGHIVIEAAVAGIKPENIHVTFEEGLLRIDAKELESEEDSKTKGYYKQEMLREYHYTTNLPRLVNTESVEAHT